jgi:hypothetical protein
LGTARAVIGGEALQGICHGWLFLCEAGFESVNTWDGVQIVTYDLEQYLIVGVVQVEGSATSDRQIAMSNLSAPLVSRRLVPRRPGRERFGLYGAGDIFHVEPVNMGYRWQ